MRRHATYPVVTTGTGMIELGKLLGGFVRPQQAVCEKETRECCRGDPHDEEEP